MMGKPPSTKGTGTGGKSQTKTNPGNLPEKAKTVLPEVYANGQPLGQENIEPEDLLMPRIRLLQQMSQEVVDEETKSGTFKNSLTGEILDELEVMIFYHTKNRVLFSRAIDPTGKGVMCMSLDGKHSLGSQADCSTCEHSQWNRESGESPKCNLVYNFPCFVLNSTNPKVPIVMSLMKTSVTQAKQLISAVKLGGLQWWSIVWSVKSEKKENEKGKFFVFKLSQSRKPTTEEIDLAVKGYQEVAGKKITVEQDDRDDPRGHGKSEPDPGQDPDPDA